MITEYQSHSGAVNTSTTPSVGYTFVEAASGANNSRQTGMVYPNGRTLTYNYSTGNVDNSISRLSSITDGSTTLESYQYLGLDQAVIRSHPQPGIDLTYVKQSGESNGDAGDQYTGLDRFGRIVDQRWIKTSTGTAKDRFQYGYDRDGNVLYKNNLVLPTRSELYHANGSTAGYDNLNQLTAFARGTLSDTNSDGIPDTIATNSQSQSWTTDGQGNFTSITTNGTTQSRTHDQQNELTGVGSTSLTYDAAGNLKTDEQNRTYTYDAWGQLISVSVPNNSSSIQASYSYDALGHRIKETSGGVTRDLYYSTNWQVIEERVSNVTQAQYVWSPVYVDAMIERDQDTDGNGTLDQRLYVQTDANFNVTAITDANGNVQERYQYDPYGKVTVLTPVPPVQGPPGSSGDGWGWITSSQYGWQYFHQGGRQDTATGLLNFRNRDYSTSLMRWTSNDPLGFGGGDTNTYRYEGNGPNSNNDPEGLQAEGQPNGPNGNNVFSNNARPIPQYSVFVQRIGGNEDTNNPSLKSNNLFPELGGMVRRVHLSPWDLDNRHIRKGRVSADGLIIQHVKAIVKRGNEVWTDASGTERFPIVYGKFSKERLELVNAGFDYAQQYSPEKFMGMRYVLGEDRWQHLHREPGDEVFIVGYAKFVDYEDYRYIEPKSENPIYWKPQPDLSGPNSRSKKPIATGNPTYKAQLGNTEDLRSEPEKDYPVWLRFDSNRLDNLLHFKITIDQKTGKKGVVILNEYPDFTNQPLDSGIQSSVNSILYKK